mgnify:CR=1 FL=1
MEKKKKVVVAFSGGLDTSFTVMYLAKEKGYEVYAACANTGGFSPEQLKTNEENAYKLGAKEYVTIDVTQEYYEKSLRYMVFGNVLRNGTYPISVSSERIFQALAIARYANEIGADAIAHGSTGAGNDQIRFDMTFLVMAPGVEIITLTRDMALSRQEEIDYLNQHGFAADFTKLKYSYNVGLWGTSICGGEILDSAQGLPESAYLKHCTKEGSEQLRLTFEKGELKAVNDETFDDPIKAIQKVEEIGAAYGIGRDMHVGDTIIGIKGRVGFEAAAPMLIIGAHKFLEKYTLSKWQQYWKDQVANWYGMFLHESQYLEPVMRDIEAMLESSQRKRYGYPRASPTLLLYRRCRKQGRPCEKQVRRIRRNAERLDGRRCQGIHQSNLHGTACILFKSQRRENLNDGQETETDTSPNRKNTFRCMCRTGNFFRT